MRSNVPSISNDSTIALIIKCPWLSSSVDDGLEVVKIQSAVRKVKLTNVWIKDFRPSNMY